MKYVADLHQHSKYSRATSKASDLPGFHRSALLKGITLVGTGDFTHPAWFDELTEQLLPAEEGLYRLADPVAREAEADVPGACTGTVRFVLTAEISSIYKRGGRTRKVHNLIFAPDLATAGRIRDTLDQLGNIRSDGRPILGLDSRDLLEIVLEAGDGAFLVPAHIWTPWFSLLGSKSGFDTVEECFGDLTGHIFAVETGLSSDPPMNWSLSMLDRYTLISNSDSHSTAKMGREANLLDGDLSFPGLRRAMESGEGWLGTIEFHPEEGKYHLDGHRKCGRRLTPAQTAEHEGLCPACGKKVTVGVLNRVQELADRPLGEGPEGAAGYESLVPLAEIVGECLGRGPATKGVARVMHGLAEAVGSELFVLRHAPLEDVSRASTPLLGEALRRLRAGEVRATGGYDGEFGRIRLFDDGEIERLRGQATFFAAPPSQESPSSASAPGPPSPSARAPASKGRDTMPAPLFARRASAPVEHGDPLSGLDPDQRRAAEHEGGPLCILAGPGTGKTRTLTHRIALRVEKGTVGADRVLALTFTRRAAREMGSRLVDLLGEGRGRAVWACTVHAFCLDLLRAHAGRTGRSAGFEVLSEERAEEILLAVRAASFPGTRARAFLAFREDISRWKQELKGAGHPDVTEAAPPLPAVYEAYEKALEKADALDFDDLLFATVLLLRHDPALLASVKRRYPCVSVDEFQDLNHAQYELVRLLGGDDLCVIGDPDQSIYGFRGADSRIFDRFLADVPGAVTVELRQSYRSSDPILLASGQVISAGPRGANRGALRSSLPGLKVQEACEATARAEAEFVHHGIERLLGGVSHFSLDSGRVASEASEAGVSFADVAVLARLDALLDPVAKALARAGIPFQRSGDATLPSEVDAVPWEADKVSLLTLHASKGLEFSAVFIVGCEATLLPLDLAEGFRADPEEERRLFYVGMTRARDVLYLCRARQRTLFGKRRRNPVSPFVAAVKQELREGASLDPTRPKKGTRGRQLSLFDC